MSGSIIVVVDHVNNKKHSVKITPSTLLSSIIQQVCEKFSLNPENYVLSLQNKVLDSNLSIRFAGINSGQKLILRSKASSPSLTDSQLTASTNSNTTEEKASSKMEEEEEIKSNKLEEKDVEEPKSANEQNVKVYLPSSQELNLSQISVPEEFYELSSQEFSELIEKDKQRRQDSTVLKTREMREREEESKKKRYSSCTIRFRFQDKTILEGVFSPSNTTQDLENFVKQHITDSNQDFFLFTTPPPKKLLKNQTLYEQQLVPTALVLISGKCKLKDQLLLTAKGIPIPSASQVVESKQESSSKQTSTSDKKTNDKSSNKKTPSWFSKGKK